MANNPILEEIYAAREKLLADCGGDLHAYIEDARQRALASGHPIANAPIPPVDGRSNGSQPIQDDLAKASNVPVH
jgi:hypothetical protein